MFVPSSFECSAAPLDLPSFPTRRSSDLRADTRRRRTARPGSLQAGRYHHLHRLQGLRGGVCRVERYAVHSDHLRQHLRSEEHTSELQSLRHLVCRLLLEKKKTTASPHAAPSRCSFLLRLNAPPPPSIYPLSLHDALPISGPIPGEGVQRDLEVCKLVDTTTCIGCKACEVACVEWNDMPFTPTTFDNT